MAMSAGPIAAPRGAGLLTGRYQQRFGHEFNPGDGGAGLPVSETTIADRLKKAGYATGLVGKWHLGGVPKFHPNQRGFDEFFGFLGGAHSYFADRGAPILRNDDVVDEGEYLTDAFGREAVAFIDRHKDHPFFLYLAFNAVHTPMQATDARLKRFEKIADPKRRTYAAMTSAMDDAVGQVLDKLQVGPARRRHAGLLLLRQRRPDHARHYRQRIEQCAISRFETDDPRRGNPRAVCRPLARQGRLRANRTTAR